jgi:hypothetical protein
MTGDQGDRRHLQIDLITALGEEFVAALPPPLDRTALPQDAYDVWRLCDLPELSPEAMEALTDADFEMLAAATAAHLEVWEALDVAVMRSWIGATVARWPVSR